MNDERRTEPAEGDEGFLSRWSRRKRQASESPMQAPEPASTAEPQPPPLTDADMPPIDSLDEGSDYSGFLSPGVSEELRQLALRKLFRSAAFNLRDGLDDYDDDFSSFAKLGDIVTREMRVRQAIDEAREKAKTALADAESPLPDAADVPATAKAAESQAAAATPAPIADQAEQADPSCLEEQPDEQPPERA